jgi:hypothetical protein
MFKTEDGTRRIFGPNRDEVTGGRRQNEELHNLYSSPSVIRMIKSRRRWAGHAAEDSGGKARRKETTRKTKT